MKDGHFEYYFEYHFCLYKYKQKITDSTLYINHLNTILLFTFSVTKVNMHYHSYVLCDKILMLKCLFGCPTLERIQKLKSSKITLWATPLIKTFGNTYSGNVSVAIHINILYENKINKP